jgi:hypothetical protein
MTLPARSGGPLVDLRVHAHNPNVQGVVIEDPGHSVVRVKWDDGDDTWSRRDLLYLVEDVDGFR